MNQFFIKGLSKLKLLKSLNINSSVIINKKPFTIPLIKGNGKDNLIQAEKWMTTVLQKLLAAGNGSFIDVGVNIGQTLLKIKSIDRGIKYFGFEPNPTCVFYIDELIRINKFTDVVIYPVGISDTTGIAELNFYYDADTDSAASIIKDFRPWQKIYRKSFIPCFTAENFNKLIDFSIVRNIKIDVEGAELEVLYGLKECIEKSRPNIIMEILPVYKKENSDRYKRQLKIQEFLKIHDYKLFRVRKKTSDEFSHFEPLNEIGIHSDMDLTNYIFLPKENSFLNN
ncbi:MAG TPA: FkbM family methyltransferase [Chitinophagaceae bacterium]|nr:FkbM family methyltransferase [Chitinophagaceae bacterium]